MSAIKVSVIVPVYNAETTIRKCLDSLMNQTLSGWELILVDDGSPDKSGDICDEYKENCGALSDGKCEAIVIHRENGGVSAARQTGLEAAQGEYVIHADPDDWAEPTMLQDLYELAKSEDADMVVCDFYCDSDNRTIYRHQQPSSTNNKDVLNDLFGPRVIGTCWNKLIKKECIIQCNARFPSGIKYCEDVSFNVQLLKHDIKIAYFPRAYYHYVQLPSSITNNYTLKTFKNHKGFVDFLTTILPAESLPVYKAKLLVKKLVFRNSVLNDSEFLKLYPEVVATDDKKILLKWMYNLAFQGHLAPAKALRNGLNLIQKLTN